MKYLFFPLFVFCLTSLGATPKPPGRMNPELPARPNILWLVAEDLSPYIAAYGDRTVATPNLDRLASEGVVYDQVYSPAPVCAPARASIITGMYPTTIGANHMRTGPFHLENMAPQAFQNETKNRPADVPVYEAIPGPEVRMFTEYLRAQGYYCSNNFKEDYQFKKTKTAWDECSPKAHWRNRKPGQPFFSVFNFEVTHESMIWLKAKDSLWVDPQLPVQMPPYLPDTEIAKNDMRRMYSNLKEMDAQVGQVLRELEEDGLLENTVIFWYADHGGPFPRQKRQLQNSGMKAPMIIRFPHQPFAGQRDARIISFVDFAPTVLSLTGIKPPKHMQGGAFLGPYIRKQEPVYAFGAADRFGKETDTHRAATDGRFKYIRYYHPEKPMFLYTGFRDDMPIMRELYRLRDEGKLTEAQKLWFRSSKPMEELFDCTADPHEIHDLAGDPAYADKLKELRQACEGWVAAAKDKNIQPETELFKELWPDGKQPLTAQPILKLGSNTIAIKCDTKGASIGYKLIAKGENPGNTDWQIYSRPFKPEPGKELVVIAHRIGFKPSEFVRLPLDGGL